jgi:hypothetical protein
MGQRHCPPEVGLLKTVVPLGVGDIIAYIPSGIPGHKERAGAGMDNSGAADVDRAVV